MHWIAPSEKDTATATLKKRLWAAAEQAAPAPCTCLKSQGYIGGRPQEPAFGVEKTDENGRVCRMVPMRKHIAVHGLEGDIHQDGQTNNAHYFPSF
jgi:hypothetical protein